MNSPDSNYKTLIKRLNTSAEKDWHEEYQGELSNVKVRDLWSEDISYEPPLQTNSTIEVLTKFELTNDLTVDNSRSWLVCSTLNDVTTRVGDFIRPDKSLSRKYHIAIYDDNDERVNVGDIPWQFDYDNGVLIFGEDLGTNGFAAPFYISGYRYIGQRGFDSTLDSAYDGPSGSGSGRIIQADFGPVQITSSNGNAALQLDPVLAPPDQMLEDGQITYYGGIMYVYDDTRGKWLSMNRQSIMFGAKRADGCYLNVADFSSSTSGWPALRDGTITGITAQASGGYATKEFTIFENSNTIPLYNFNLAGRYHSNGNLNIDFDANDLVKILVSSHYGITHNVVINLEISWRI